MNSQLYKTELEKNASKLNAALINIRAGMPNDEVVELLNQRAMLKDLLIEALELELKALNIKIAA